MLSWMNARKKCSETMMEYISEIYDNDDQSDKNRRGIEESMELEVS